MKQQYHNVKVVSRDFITDFFARIQNMLGLNLEGYEKMMHKGIKQLQSDMKRDNIKLEWFRYEISELSNGAMTIMIYGERK